MTEEEQKKRDAENAAFDAAWAIQEEARIAAYLKERGEGLGWGERWQMFKIIAIIVGMILFGLVVH